MELEYLFWLKTLKYLTNKKDFLGEDSYIIREGLINIIDFLEADGFYYTIDIWIFYADKTAKW